MYIMQVNNSINTSFVYMYTQIFVYISLHREFLAVFRHNLSVWNAVEQFYLPVLFYIGHMGAEGHEQG